jgi:hypothetical protein
VSKKQRILRQVIWLLVLSLVCSISGLAVDAATVEVSQEIETKIEAYRRFAEYRYGIELPKPEAFAFLITVLDVEFNEDLENVNLLQAVDLAVDAGNLRELAATYEPARVEKVLSEAGLMPPDDAKETSLQALATSLDLQLLPLELLDDIDYTACVTDDVAIYLTGKVLELNGLYKNDLGKISDPDIYAKVYQAWDMQALIEADELREIINEVLEQGVITGYNVKDLTFTYGHSEIVHAIQLIGLLQREGLDARVQLEPKSSAFIYLQEWGEPEETPDYQVAQIENGNYIAYAKEYDISFEFVSVEDKAAFQDIVLQYAKRNQEDMTGLIRHSWWQPLYYSLTELDDYVEITNNFIKDGTKMAQTFSLKEDSEVVLEALKALGTEPEAYQFWVDQPFYNYLIGESQ